MAFRLGHSADFLVVLEGSFRARARFLLEGMDRREFLQCESIGGIGRFRSTTWTSFCAVSTTATVV